MAVSIATYGDRGRFVDDHNVLVDMNEGDRLAGDRDFVPATIHPSGYLLARDRLSKLTTFTALFTLKKRLKYRLLTVHRRRVWVLMRKAKFCSALAALLGSRGE